MTTNDMVRTRPPLPLLVLVLLLFLGGFLRFHGLGRESLWNDELDSRRVSGAPSARQVIAETLAEDGHPPTHNLLLHAIERSFGDSEEALRFPSAVCGVLSIAAMFLLGRELYGQTEGLLGAGLLAVLWCPIYYSQEARPYSALLLMVLLASTAWVALLKIWTEQKSTPPFLIAGYLLAALGCCYLHHFGAGLIFFQGFVALLLGRPRAVVPLYAALLAFYAPGIVYLLRQRRHSGSWAWIEHPGFRSVPEYLKFLFNYSWALAAGALMLGLVAFLRFRRGSPVERRLGLLCQLSPSALLGLWITAPFAGAIALSYLSFPLLTNRNLLICLPAVYLLLARSITLLARGAGLALLSGLLLAGLIAHLLFGMHFYTRPDKEQFREAVAEVLSHPEAPGTVVLGRAHHREYFDYYFARLGSPRRIDLLTGADADVAEAGSFLDTRKPAHVWLISGHLTPGERFLSFLRERYREAEHRTLVGADARLFE
ncbi:MAG TPA: glycosyltransferase family 39 protein, partial [Thermoanaerobaculia bacterium]|nr:glycosyltransferase family 39 protein [Thermoanaerobaculia bacterium]